MKINASLIHIVYAEQIRDKVVVCNEYY